MEKVFGYARVSTVEQNTERQEQAIKKYWPTIKDEDIFIDKKSGKNFERGEYKRLKEVMREGDTLIIQDTDRLGRNKKMVKEELQYFKNNGIRLKILNFPTTLVDVKENSWVIEMVNNILIEVYTSLDEEDYRKRRQRQREGIDIAKDKGIYIGGRGVYSGGKLKDRKDNDFIRIYKVWNSAEITTKTACNALEMSSATFYRRVYDYEIKQGIRQPGEKKERRKNENL